MKKLSCLCLILLMLVSQLCLFIYYPTYMALGSTPSAWTTTVQLMLSSDGSLLGWSGSSGGAHYVLLDENEAAPDTGNYIFQSSATYVNDSWNFADLTIPSFPTDYHVNVTAAFYATKAGTTCNFYGFALIGGTEYSAGLTLTTSYTWLYKTWTADPSTGLNWTVAAINAMQIGVRGKLNAATYEYVAAAYVNVTYGWTPESETANQQFLWCDGFNNTTTAQTMVGSSPYNSVVDWNTNYFNTSNATGTVSWFSFDNTTFPSVGLVYFEFRAYLNAIGYANFTFSDGENTTIYKYTITSDNNVWKWYSINITDWIGGSSAKVNATIVKFLLTQYALNDTYDCFRLNVTYGDPTTTANILNVCYYNSTETNWYGVGNTPYLDPSMDNYFTYSITNGNASWFSFEDTTQSPQQVFFELQGYTASGIQIAPYINNGSATTQLSTRVLVGTTTTWFEWNVTNILSTTTTINAAILKLQYVNVSGSNMYIYTARLRLYSHCYPYSNLVNVSDSRSYSDAVFSCYWYDSVALNVGTLTHNAGGSYVNATTALSGTSAWSNFTVTLPSTTTDVTYWFTANDTAGNEERTSNNFTLPVIWNATATFTKINVNTATTSHTLGRKSITGNGRIWIGYPVQVGTIFQLCYNSSADGITWDASGLIRDNIDMIGQGFWYMSESSDSGVWHIHVQWCNETDTISPVEYRRGILNSNGTITWETDWQEAVPAEAGRRLAVNGITTTSNGTTYMQYTSRIEGCETWLTKNSLQNGTWATASEYPLNLTAPTFLSLEGYPYALNDTTVYCFMTSTYGSVTGRIMGRYVVDNAISTLENITALNQTEGRDFSTAIDGIGNLHLAYASGGGLYYCRWDTTLEAWDVIDELFGANSNFPAVSVNTVSNVPYVYVNWVTGESNVYLNMRNSTAWTYGTGTRILSLTPHLLTSQVDPNTIPQNSTTFVTFILSVTNVTDAQDQLWTLTYPFPYGIEYTYSFTDMAVSIVSFFWNKGLQFITTTTTHSTDTLVFFKALAYSFLDVGKSVASIVYNKALQFITTMTTQPTDTSNFFKELGFAFLNTGRNTATMTYNLAAIFLNLEYTFTHPVLPQAFLTVQKELQFNILQTVQAIASLAWNKATAITFWEYTFMQPMMPKAFLTVQKELQFSFAEQLQALATMVMNKALRTTLWEMINTANPQATLTLSTTVPTSYVTKAFVAAMFFMLILISLPVVMLILARRK